MFSSGKSSGVLKDPNFKDTVLLLHGDGTSGANNLSISNSSPAQNTFNITNTPGNGFYGMVQGSFSPYLPNWSNYFSGGTSYISIPANSNYTIGTSNFTMEFWVNVVAFASSGLGSGLIVSHQSGGMFLINLTPTGSIQFVVNNNAGVSDTKVGPTSATLLSKNIWYHIACVRNDTELSIWINGVKDGNTTTLLGGTNIVSYLGAKPFYIGVGTDAASISTASASGPFTGYISNYRYVLGTALYTTNFSPPTSPLTAVAGTKILTCHKNRFMDELGAVVSAINSPVVVSFSPFSPATPYNTSIHGGSLSLPAIASTYLQSTGDFSVGDGKLNSSGDFTVEAWVYPYSGRQDWISLTYPPPAGSTNIRLLLYYDGTSLTYYAGDTSPGPGPRITYAIPATQIANQWNHVAVVRKYPGTITLLSTQTVSLTQGTATTITNGYSAAETATLTLTQPSMSSTTATIFQPGKSITLAGFSPTVTTDRTIVITQGTLSITGLLTVNARTPTTSTITLYMQLTGTNIPDGTYISAVNPTPNTLTGLGGNGTYQTTSPNGPPMSAVGWNSTIPGYSLKSPAMNINNTFPILSMVGSTTTCTITFRLTGTLPSITKGTVSGTANFSITQLYLNGTQVGTGNVANNGSGTTGPAYTDQFNWPTLTTATIGKDSARLIDTTTNGYITDVRISRSAVYTATFTPNTTFLSGSSSILMLNFQNGKIYDSTANNHIATYNLGPSINNIASRYGGGSLYFNGTQFARFLNPDPIRIRNNDFTIEGWFYFNTLSTQTLFAFDTVTTGTTGGLSAIRLDINSSGKLLLFMSSTGTTWDINGTNSSATVSASTWYHIAVVRSGSGSNNIQVYLNGTSTITATFTGSGYTAVTNVYTLGAVYNVSNPFNYLYAYVDEFRVSKVARYTGNFGPQFRIFPDN